MLEGMSNDEQSRRTVRLDTWETILEHLRCVGQTEDEAGKINLLVELIVNLRLLGQDQAIPDRRTRSGNMESLYAELEGATRKMLDSVREPSSRFIYYAREVVKKLPVKQDAEDMIEQIRMAAEAFEEERTEDDPMRGFAGDLRKEVHRRLSPRIIQAYLEPYLALVEGNPEPIMRAGYVALPSRFDPAEESESFIDLARELKDRLDYLWDYGAGDMAVVKRSLEQSMPIFERCFLKAEVSGFLELLTPERLARRHVATDMLKRLASFKRNLKESFTESRIGLYDMLLVDLSLGRLIFLLANDLTNNHFLEVTPRNGKEALGVLAELLTISTVKGLAIGDADRNLTELEELRTQSANDYIRGKRCLSSIGNELQAYLQRDIIDRMSGTLNRVLEAYGVPTSRLSQIKTRFFNNFVRRTQVHVLSEFVEKVRGSIDLELERQSISRQLYADYRPLDGGLPLEPGSCVATTWKEVDELIRPTLGGKGNGLVDMARLGLAVPPAFILGFPLFAACEADGELDPGLRAIIDEQLAELERRCDRRLGDPDRPLFVSVRSGAPVSMPGVMVTVLNVGLVPAVRYGTYGRARTGLTEALYRRFLENAAGALASMPARLSGSDGGSGTAAMPPDLKTATTTELEACLRVKFGEGFLTDPREQLLQAIRLVYASRKSSAVDAFSRTLAMTIRSDTAVTVQRMVFGNLNDSSMSGVVITRDPITGADRLFGDFKRQAQGEEVVMGSVGTESIACIDEGIASALDACKRRLVEYYRQDLDLEFTVEDGKLYLLQARAARLGAFAQLVADKDFLERGLIDLGEFRTRLERLELANASIALPRADFRFRRWNPPLAVGVPINGGVVSGTLVLSNECLKEAEVRRESVVYLAHTTKPTDFTVMNGAHAIVTIYPGRTSHAAITALSINKTCIVGLDNAELDLERRCVHFRSGEGSGHITVAEGERVTADGNTGALYRGVAPISEFFLPVADIAEAIRDELDPVATARTIGQLIDEKLSGLSRETSIHRSGLDSPAARGMGRVIVRVDANVAVKDGAVADRRSLLRFVDTLSTLLERGATPIVCSHLGDPGAATGSGRTREEQYRDYSLQPVADVLAAILGDRFVFHQTSIATSGLLVSAEDMLTGKVNLLENLRFATGEKDNDDTFARDIAELSDGWYLNDAFNVCHRRHASIVGVPRYCPHRLAGPQVIGELSMLGLLLDEPEPPFVAVFKGTRQTADLGAQLGVMSALINRVDRMIITGEGVDGMLPRLESLATQAPGRLVIQPRDGELEEALDGAATILWSGASGLTGSGQTQTDLPDPAAAAGVSALKRAIDRNIPVVVCSAADRYGSGVPGSRLHLSSGPAAFLEYLERLSLPGITVLDPAPDTRTR
jgi:3-phosphoglycerate kinase/phosphohistidine swiveling domain-containing protein